MDEHYEDPRCRVCGNRVRVLDDGESAGAHTSRLGPVVKDSAGVVTGRGRCPGSYRPIAGEPPCTPTCRTIGSWGVPYVKGKAHAATHVCGDVEHQREAAEWVKSITGEWGSFTPFPDRKVTIWEPPKEEA